MTKLHRVPAAILRKQLRDIFVAWGMADDVIDPTVEVMVETDLHGIDSHVVGMMPMYAVTQMSNSFCVKPLNSGEF